MFILGVLAIVMATHMSLVRHIDLVLLRAFVAVAQTGSISAAAGQLHLTQGAISQQLKRLEAFFACKLLERDSRGAQLTAQGVEFLPKARRLLDLNDSLCASMAGATITEILRIGIPYDMAGAYLAPVLKAFSQAYPHVEVIVVSGSSVDLMSDFAKGLIDLIIRQCPEAESTEERLALAPLVWLASAEDVFSQRPLPLCFVTPTCAFRPVVFSRLAEADIGWRVIFENASVDTTLATVQSGLALTPWLRPLVPDGFRVLGEEAGLPSLPDFAIELHVPQHASEGAQGMATLIRQHISGVYG